MTNSCSSIIAFEGMPGAGKSTCLLDNIHRLKRSTIVLPETNPLPHKNYKNPREFYDHVWLERMSMLSRGSAIKFNFILDRSYYSNLAFIYATSSFLEFEKARDTYLKALEGQRCIDKIIVFDIAPLIGLQRKQKALDALPWPWQDICFLEKMRNFYDSILPSFYSGTLKHADGTHPVCIEDLGISVFFESKAHVEQKVPHEFKEFSSRYQLGGKSSYCIEWGPFEIVYFRAFSAIRKKPGKIFFLTNRWIKELIKHG